MIRVILCILLISLFMIGCNKSDKENNIEQQSENADQKSSDITGKNMDDALFKEIQTIAKRDFRKTTWGMDKYTVKLTEADDPRTENDSALIYKRKFAGLEALLGYIFVEDKLVRARYMFHQQYSDFNKYIIDHDKLEKALVKKYGNATKERTIWSNDLYTKIPTQWGIALSQGYLTYISYWITNKTEISLTLKGENEKIDFWLDYKSKELGKLEKNTEIPK
jgi:hypothetical protein